MLDEPFSRAVILRYCAAWSSRRPTVRVKGWTHLQARRLL